MKKQNYQTLVDLFLNPLVSLSENFFEKLKDLSESDYEIFLNNVNQANLTEKQALTRQKNLQILTEYSEKNNLKMIELENIN